MRIVRRLAMFAIGAGAAYFLDPSRGAQRRGRVAEYLRQGRQPSTPAVPAEEEVVVLLVPEATG